MAWDPDFVNPNIDAITMTYGYMRNYEDRVRRAVNTPDRNGRFALWQGGMEPNIPVDRRRESPRAWRAPRPAPSANSARARAANGWPLEDGPHRAAGVGTSGPGESARPGLPRLTYTQADADGLFLVEPAPRTVRGARDLLSVALQYGNAFGQGLQAAALKPADFFGNEDVLYLMEDMATGEIRLSILWEWLHKRATLTADDPAVGVKAGDTFTAELCRRLLDEEYAKLLAASNRDVHDNSKATTLPISREIVDTYVMDAAKMPWFVDLLNINLNNTDLAEARRRIRLLVDAYTRDGTRITENLDFSAA
jgi:malate synthase